MDNHENDCKKVIDLELQGEKVRKLYNASLRANVIQICTRKDGFSPSVS